MTRNWSPKNHTAVAATITESMVTIFQEKRARMGGTAGPENDVATNKHPYVETARKLTGIPSQLDHGLCSTLLQSMTPPPQPAMLSPE